MSKLPSDVYEAVARLVNLSPGSGDLLTLKAAAALESAILSALDSAREGALREAEDVLQRYLSKQDHQNQTVYDATCIMIENIRLIASRPSPAAESARESGERKRCPKCTGALMSDGGCRWCGAPRSETEER